MKFTSDIGVEFDTEGGFAQTATTYARNKGVPVLCVLATHPDSKQEYVLLEIPDGEAPQPIFSSQQFEEIGVRIDVMAFDRQSQLAKEGETR